MKDLLSKATEIDAKRFEQNQNREENVLQVYEVFIYGLKEEIL